MKTLVISSIIGLLIVPGAFQGGFAAEKTNPSSPSSATESATSVPLQIPDGPAVTRVRFKDRYHAVEFDEFRVADGVAFPADFIPLLQDEILKESGKSEKFPQLVRKDQNPMAPDKEVLRVTGTVIYYDKGDRGERYLGFGGGAAKLVVRAIFTDRGTNEILMKEPITGTLSGGAFGGGEKGITHEFAKTFVNTTRFLMEKPIPAGSGAKPDANAEELEPATKKIVVTISRDNFEEGQTQLNAKATAGYRIVSVLAIGGRAEVTMEPKAAPSETYAYRLIHVLSPANLSKDLTKAGRDGFRYCPHTTAWVTGGFGIVFAVAEKPPVRLATVPQYRMHMPMQISNVPKDIAKDQRDGFELVEVLQINQSYLVLLEKPGE